MRRLRLSALGCAMAAMVAGCGLASTPVAPSAPVPGEAWGMAPGFEVQQASMVRAGLLLNTPQVRQFQYILREVNAFRAANNLPALASDGALIRAAGRHSQDMATRNYLTHNSPEGTTPGDRMRAAGASFNSWAENIGYQSPPEASAAQRMVEAWKNSPPHRANMLNPNFKRTGIVPYLRASDGYWYYTQVFSD